MALLRSYLASEPALHSSAGRAQFLLTLCCARMGDPASGSFATRCGPTRLFEDEGQLRQFGELMAELALPLPDVVAIVAAFGSGDSIYDCDRDAALDFGSTDPHPAFAAWAERVDFPNAWGGIATWRHFRGLKVGPNSRA